MGAAPRQLADDVTNLAQAVRADPTWLLYFCILLDLIGMCSYLILFIGEITDLWWAPMFGFCLHYLFGSTLISTLGVVEEILPFTDFVPTATLAWSIVHLKAFEPVRGIVVCQNQGKINRPCVVLLSMLA